MSRRHIALAAVAATAIAAGLVFRLMASVEAAAPDVPTYIVKKGTFERRIIARGNLSAVNAAPISPPRVPGQHAVQIAWIAKDGTAVHKGDVVMRLSPIDLQRQLLDGQADLATAEANLQKTRTMAKVAETTRDSNAALAELELRNTQKFQPKNDQIFSRHEIIEGAIDEELSREKVDHAREANTIQRRISRSQVGEIAVQKQSATRTIKLAQMGLESLVVRAPHDGIVVLKRNWQGRLPQAGQTVWAGQAIAEIPILSEMQAEIYVLEVDGSGLRPELPVEVTLESQPQKIYHGTILRVAKLAQPRTKDVPVQYFAVTVKLAKTDPKVMKPGTRVSATVVIHAGDAIAVPRQAVFYKDGEARVFRLSGDGFAPVKVKLGAETPGRVVVTEGLSAGDRIALADPTGAPTQASAGKKSTEDEKEL
ncbi:MAG TPA: HlyD family efflux transporter periplasmic adaptor subunit [Kofleriaceae bacterium]|nr:HlyD family efflux transporter periplasmic adaptor subunit [Kofleriaceae bacterium]